MKNILYKLLYTLNIMTMLFGNLLLTSCSGSATGSLSSDAPPIPDSTKLLSITPLTKTVALGGTISFTAADGTEPYSFDVYYGNGSITSAGTTGTYQAPSSQGSAVVRAQDAEGNTGYANIEIIDAPVIQPTNKTLAVTNKFPFAVLSGKAPYTFAIASGEGTINSSTGEFTAGANAGAVVVRVTDADGRSADANVTVNSALSFAEKNAYVEKTNNYTLSATGGVTPYRYVIAAGAGTIDSTSGVFTAPEALGTTSVYVFDSLGNVDLAVVNISTALSISPTNALIAKNSNLTFTGVGGVPPYSYAIQTGGVGSMSTLTGQYTAPTGTGSATIRVTDALGHTSDASVTITNNLSFSVATIILAAGNTIDVAGIVSGGVTPLTYTVPSSQGLFSDSIYTAPNTPGVYTITIADSQSPTPNSVTTTVLVNSALILLPTSAQLAADTQKIFSASGGVPPYTYSIQSGVGSITDGIYTAPSISGSAVILVTDARGNTASASVTVQAALAIIPTTKTLNSGESFTFTATGGNTPYAFSLVSGAGAINSNTGLYTAPGSSGLATVRVEDAAGNRKDALITILNPLSISPPTISLIKNGAITFTASGGAGPYSFSIASGEGSINATTGVFTAAATPGTTTVRVTDSLASVKDATVTIYDGLSISPFTKNLAVNQTFTFTANGGITPYTYSLVSGVGTISNAGAFSSSTAGAAVVRVTDADGNTSDATISVSSALAINPTSKTLSVNNQFTFSATGGVPPYAFSVSSGSGTVTTSGDYKAPSSSTSAIVRVTDSAGTTADASVTVNAALTLSPATTTLAAGGTQSYVAAGGVGPYVYAVISGGGSFTNSTYTAPSVATAASVSLVVTDTLGNTAYATVTLNSISVTISSPNSSDFITSSNKTAFPLSGTCSESGQAVTVSATDGTHAAITASPTCSSGTWSTNLNLTSLNDVPITITANHANANGVAATPASVTVSKDGTTPTITITTPATASYIANSVTVTGTCSKLGPINISATGSVSAITSCTASAYSSTLDFTAVSEGSITITATHTDSAGNAATPASVNVIKDTLAPSISAFTITNSSPTNTTTYNLNFTATGTPTQYCILENSTTLSSCSWQNTPLPTAATVSSTNNDKTLSAWVKDAAGNTSTRVDSNMVHLDTLVPTVTITVPSAAAYVNASNVSAYTVTGTCNKEGGTVTIKAGSTSVGTATCSASAWTTSAANFSSIAEGSISLTAVLTDLAASSTTSTVVSITKDVTAPTAPSSLADGTWMNSTSSSAAITFTSGTDTGGSGIQKHMLRVIATADSAEITSYAIFTTGSTVTGLTLTDGANYKVQIKAIDNAGNESTVATSAGWTVDTTSPVITAFAVTNSSPTNTTTYSLTFTATGTPTKYCILENSTTVGSCSWQNTPLPTAFVVSSTANAKILSAWIKDAAGNVSTRSDSNSVTLNTAPGITSILPTSGDTAGGTSVAITGANFVSGAVAKIGSTNCTSTTFNSSTSLTCVTPSGTAGAKNVVVTNPDTQTGTLTNGFTYTVPSTQTLSYNSTTSANFTTSSPNLIYDGSSVKMSSSLPFTTNVSFGTAAYFQQENSNYTTFSGGAVQLLAPYAINTPYYVYTLDSVHADMTGRSTIYSSVVTETFPSNIATLSPSNMTSNTAPGPYVVSRGDGGTDAYMAFNGTCAGDCSYLYFNGGAFPKILNINFGSGNAKVIDIYTYTMPTPYSAHSANTWDFQGSNDNSTWTTLDSQSGITWVTGGDSKTFSFSNSTAYQYYRIYITSGNYPGGLGYVMIDSLALGAQVNTTTRYMASFDNRNTWQYWNGSSWTSSLLSNIQSNGMTSSQLSTALVSNWTSALGNTLDFAVALQTNNSTATPTVSNIAINSLSLAYSVTTTNLNHFDLTGKTAIQSMTVSQTTPTSTGTMSPSNMTNNTTPSPYVASRNDGGADAYNAFDGNSNFTYFDGGSFPRILSLDLGSGNNKIVDTYSMALPAGYSAHSANTWDFQGSNNNSSWTTLDSRSGITWSAGENKTFSFTNPTAYRYYRINISSGNYPGGGTYVMIESLVLKRLYLTSIKYLVSFDGRSTWKYWNGSAWTAATLANIETSGMTSSQMSTALVANWTSSLGTTLDIAASLQSIYGDTVPTLTSIQVTSQ